MADLFDSNYSCWDCADERYLSPIGKHNPKGRRLSPVDQVTYQKYVDALAKAKQDLEEYIDGVESRPLEDNPDYEPSPYEGLNKMCMDLFMPALKRDLENNVFTVLLRKEMDGDQGPQSDSGSDAPAE